MTFPETLMRQGSSGGGQPYVFVSKKQPTSYAAISILLLVLVATPANGSPTAKVAGTAVDSSGAPIPKAQVRAVGHGFQFTTTTDEQGGFAFENLPGTTGQLIVKAPGFAPLTRNWNARDPESTRLLIVLEPAAVSQTVTVTATRTATRLDQTAADVTVVTFTDLSSAGAVVFDAALRQVPGFSLFRRSDSLTANPTSQGVSLRGVGASGPSRALVLEDGIPITDPFGGWVYWDRVPRQSISSVEFVEGGASDLYGSNAMGGVINVRTLPLDFSHLSFDASYGNRNTPDVSVSSGLDYGKWALGVSADGFHTDGFVLVPQNLRGPVDTPAGVDDRAVDVTLDRRINDQTKFFVRGDYLGEARAAGLTNQTNHTTLRQLAAGVDWQSPVAGSFSFRTYGGADLFDQNFYSASTTRTSDTLTNVQRVPVQDIGFSAQWTRTAGSSQTLVTGFEAAGVSGASNESKFTNGRLTPSSAVGAGGRQRTFGVFGEDILNIQSKWVVTLGTRLDHWLNYNALSTTSTLPGPTASVVTIFPDRTEQALSPRLSVLRRLPGGWSLTGSIYRSFRAPTLNELYRSFRLGNVLTNANNYLEAEHLTGAESGATWAYPGGHVTARGVFFWSEITRPIENVTLSITPTLITRQRENLGRTRSRGVNLDLSEDLTHALHLNAGYQFTNATVISYPAGVSLVGLRLPEIPLHEATFQVRYSNPGAAHRIGRITVAVEGRAEGAAYDDDQNTLRLKPYFTLDALLSRAVGPRAEVYVAAQNLTGQRYQTALTLITNLRPPILYRVGIRFNLGRR
jgi:outer membrane receptor protein involved in Fe transport